MVDPPATTVVIARPLAGSMKTIDTVTTVMEVAEVAVEKIALNALVADMTKIAEAGAKTTTAVVRHVANMMTDVGEIVEAVVEEPGAAEEVAEAGSAKVWAHLNDVRRHPMAPSLYQSASVKHLAGTSMPQDTSDTRQCKPKQLVCI